MKLIKALAPFSVAALLVMISSCGNDTSQVVISPNDIVIGTMLAPSQGASQSQKSYQASAKLAADEANARFIASGSPYRVKLIEGDLGANADVALENLKKLYAQGVRLVVGPAETVNLISIKSFANANGMIILSNASTAPSIAETDNVYRLVPNDILQTRLLANKIKADGFSKMLIVLRNDLYGRDFRDKLKIAFESSAVGGQVIGELIYDPDATVFRDQIELLHDAFFLSSPALNPATTALVVVSFEEIVPIVTEMIAKDAPRFGAFRWYAGDGVAQINDVVANTAVAQFLLNAQFTATSPAVLDSDKPKLVDFYARLQSAVPGTPNSMYAALTHDAVTLLVKTVEDIKKSNKSESAESMKSNMALIAASLSGITGNLAFNAEGDRDSLPYGLFGLAASGTPATYTWIFNGLLTE